MNYTIERFPETQSNNLQAWNAADELLLEHLREISGNLLIVNDAFGYLNVHLADHHPVSIIDLKSQQKSIQENLIRNGKKSTSVNFSYLTESPDSNFETSLVKIPKSVDLFELFLQYVHRSILDSGIVYCGFMTKYFSPALVKTAELYFKNVTQTKAKKKARLMILSGKKTISHKKLIRKIDYNGTALQQYYGVFSADKVDLATRFLLEHIQVPGEAGSILDLAAGNGIIAHTIQKTLPHAEFHILDDSHLAVESAKLNLDSVSAEFYHHYTLTDFETESIDWIVTNPPFHFGQTIDLSIPLGLFQQSHRVLKKGGKLTIVANSNLGYHTHLRRMFRTLNIIQSNSKFHIYECIK